MVKRIARLHFVMAWQPSLLRCAPSGGWARQDSNLGPRDYESPALTAELQAHITYGCFLRSMFKSAQNHGKRGKRRDCKIQFAISPVAIMRGHLVTAKKFGKACAQRISQSQ